MKMFMSVICTILLLAAASADLNEEMMKNTAAQCAIQEGLTIQDIESCFEKGACIDEKKMGRFSFCMFDRMNFVADGGFDVEKMKAMAETMHAGNEEMIAKCKAVTEECAANVVGISDMNDASYQFMTCAMAAMKA